VSTLAKGAGLPLVWYAMPATLAIIREQSVGSAAAPNVQYHPFEDWDDFLIFSKEILPNDLFLIVSSRPGHASYVRQLARLPYHLARYFTANSFLLLFPHQLPLPLSAPELAAPVAEEVSGVKGYLKGLLSKRK